MNLHLISIALGSLTGVSSRPPLCKHLLQVCGLVYVVNVCAHMQVYFSCRLCAHA